MGVEKITFGEEEYRPFIRASRPPIFQAHQSEHDYVRPLSRAAVTVLMRSFSTPSVAI